MRVLVTGAMGQLGHDVIARLIDLNKERERFEILGADIVDFDLMDSIATRAFILSFDPSVVIHCAAYTAVDKAEEEKESCLAINVKGTENIAKVCKELEAKMLYISTDYIFEGVGEKEYDIDDQPNPINFYGLTKKMGEDLVKSLVEKHFIVRTSWAFGKNGNNFVKTMLNLAKKQANVSVVSDQFGSPTYTADLAMLLCEMIETEKYGTYHANNEGFCSWYEFACEIFKQTGLSVEVIPVTTEQYKTAARRPRNSRLSKRKIDAMGFNRLPTWQDALSSYLKEIGARN